MASTHLSPPIFFRLCPPKLSSSSPVHSSPVFRPVKQLGSIRISKKRTSLKATSVYATISLDSFFGGFGDDEDGGPPSLEDLEEKPKCPPGLRPYETMLVLRPDISEEDRLSLTHRYEEKGEDTS